MYSSYLVVLAPFQILPHSLGVYFIPSRPFSSPLSQESKYQSFGRLGFNSPKLIDQKTTMGFMYSKEDLAIDREGVESWAK